jgi:hypothetical protein
MCKIVLLYFAHHLHNNNNNNSNNNNPWRYSSDEPWPAAQLPLAVFPDCTRRYWVDMWSAHRIPQLHFQLSKPDHLHYIIIKSQLFENWILLPSAGKKGERHGPRLLNQGPNR